ncbi:hypothetical protein KAFR_0A04290 [Kazachstania africana CBS 2517]|uniref:Uncharacterized protein n=1 Tax=Kazachstania africana (strain ATCC 22294 / BCRC 22015 / CBS 2517 / CECT 1963 / NBRC 1671 / NRRL Y-8276) TaxID=1071382 RepID=H2ANB4_KAZAF|nr:hypothetical protein KAFR_0A04290 [Kazachstania africana CBS 2517]CCF55864.1 hypothetical protein KAFR_0A04290 [Kazachstania africana CBS 2517]
MSSSKYRKCIIFIVTCAIILCSVTLYNNIVQRCQALSVNISKSRIIWFPGTKKSEHVKINLAFFKLDLGLLSHNFLGLPEKKILGKFPAPFPGIGVVKNAEAGTITNTILAVARNYINSYHIELLLFLLCSAIFVSIFQSSWSVQYGLNISKKSLSSHNSNTETSEYGRVSIEHQNICYTRSNTEKGREEKDVKPFKMHFDVEAQQNADVFPKKEMLLVKTTHFNNPPYNFEKAIEGESGTLEKGFDRHNYSFPCIKITKKMDYSDSNREAKVPMRRYNVQRLSRSQTQGKEIAMPLNTTSSGEYGKKVLYKKNFFPVILIDPNVKLNQQSSNQGQPPPVLKSV